MPVDARAVLIETAASTLCLIAEGHPLDHAPVGMADSYRQEAGAVLDALVAHHPVELVAVAAHRLVQVDGETP